MIVSLVSCGSGCGSTWKWNLLPNVLCLVPAQLESLLDFLFGEHWIASVLFFFYTDNCFHYVDSSRRH